MTEKGVGNPTELTPGEVVNLVASAALLTEMSMMEKGRRERSLGR